MSKRLKKLSWDDLAEFYNKKTGMNARTKPMEVIYQWAERQPEIKKYKDGSLSFKS